MDGSGAYRGSMAFNQFLSLQEDVSLNTGSLTLTCPLVNLPGITDSIGLSISLTCTVGVKGMLGLPANWTFSIPYVIPGATLTVGGRTSIIDFSWADETGYQSGLRYVNDHGVLFKMMVPPQPLPSGKPGAYAFLYTYSDGSHDYFDATGKRLEHDDRFGNWQYFTFTNQFAGVYDNNIQSVIDSYEQTVSFAYAPGHLTIQLPHGQAVTLNITAQGVASIVDELGCATTFTYGCQSSYNVVTQITYPTGLHTRVIYASISYRTSSGSASFPAVASLLRLDSGSNFLNQSNYTYGQNTNGSTFTGYAAGYLLGVTGDSLMDSNNITYLYDTTVATVDGQGRQLTYSTRYFNYLHGLVQLYSFLVDANGKSLPCIQTINTFDISADWHSRSTNYDKPTSATTLAWSDSDSTYAPLRQSTFTYDLYGNPLNVSVATYISASQTYAAQSTSTFTYTVTTWGSEMAASAMMIDALTGAVRATLYTLTADQKNVASAVRSFQAKTASPLQAWKTTLYTYDAQGRRLTKQNGWSTGASNPSLSLPSASVSYAYAYELASCSLTVSRTDPQGNVSANKILTSYPGGTLVRATNPLGNSSTFQYDLLGRLTSSTDPLGNTTTIAYSSLQLNGLNKVRTTTSTGYITDAICDALGRQVRLLDNGGVDPVGVTREVGATTYNALGLTSTCNNLLGLSTSYAYDALKRLVSTTDPHGNVTTTVFSHMQRIASISLNGVLQSQQLSDNLDRRTCITQFANPADKSINYSRTQSTSYDGFNQATCVTHQQVFSACGSPATLYMLSFAFDADGKLSSETFTGYVSQQASAAKTFARDLFGNAVSYTKNVTYKAGNNYTWSSEVFAYDGCNNLTTKTNQLGQIENYSCNANGKLQTKTRYDGTPIGYTYDTNGNLLSVTGGGSITSYTYMSDNKMATCSLGSQTISYQYAIDGTLVRTTYPNGKARAFTLDNSSRIVAVADVSGATTQLQYSATGQLVSKVSGACVLTNQYGVVNATNDVLVAAQLTAGQQVAYDYAYDGFGRLTSTTATCRGKALLAAAYTFDAVNRTATQQINSMHGTTTTSYSYDGLDQIVAQSTTPLSGTSAAVAFSYDGNTNVLTQSQGGTQLTFTYNAADQLRGTGIRYDANGRMTADGLGTTYTYDAFDKVCTSSDAGGTISYSYYPDSLLASRAVTGGERTTFYYSDGTASEVLITDGINPPSWQTYMFQGSARVAALNGSGDSNCLLVSNSSTAGVYDSSGLTQLAYAPYGGDASQSGTKSSALFAWKQEYADPGNSLVYLRARFYHPTLKRFMSADTYPVSNRYAFGNGNPVDNTDPTGHLSQGAAMGIGIGIGALAALLTGGALGAVIGTDIGASMMVGAAAGATGSVAGDATTAGLSGQKFTAQRALVDLAAGAAGGIAGAGVGGIVGRSAMGYALESGLSRGAVTAIGAVSSGITGGIAGSAAASGVTAATYGQPFFSSSTALSMVVGGVAGLGGGLLASGAHLGMLPSPGGMHLDIMPVEATDQATFNTVAFADIVANTRTLDFSPSDRDDIASPDLRFGNRDAVVIHGHMRHIFPEVLIGGQLFHEYMTPESFADLLRNNHGFGGADINLWSCFAAKLRLVSVAQRIATRLNVNVWAPASRNSVSLAYTGPWIRYTP